MNEKTITITEKEGKYSLENNGISDFTLIGILECLLFDLKSADRRAQIPPIQRETVQEAVDFTTFETLGTEITDLKVIPETKSEEIIQIQKESAPDIRTRIKKAIEAIRGLGGEAQ